MVCEEITEKIIRAFYKVYNTLGHGFLERVYENALAIELPRYGFTVAVQKNLPVYYEGSIVGNYFADVVVDDLVILELKSVESIRSEHFAQLTNYLKASDKEVGLLFNFGYKPEFRRIFLSNSSKGSLTLKSGLNHRDVIRPIR